MIIYIYIYIYKHPLSKTLQFENIHKIYTYLLFSHQRDTLYEKLNKRCIYFIIFSNCNLFENGYIYIYIHVCVLYIDG